MALKSIVIPPYRKPAAETAAAPKEDVKSDFGYQLVEDLAANSRRISFLEEANRLLSVKIGERDEKISELQKSIASVQVGEQASYDAAFSGLNDRISSIEKSVSDLGGIRSMIASMGEAIENLRVPDGSNGEGLAAIGALRNDISALQRAVSAISNAKPAPQRVPPASLELSVVERNELDQIRRVVIRPT